MSIAYDILVMNKIQNFEMTLNIRVSQFILTKGDPD